MYGKFSPKKNLRVPSGKLMEIRLISACDRLSFFWPALVLGQISSACSPTISSKTMALANNPTPHVHSSSFILPSPRPMSRSEPRFLIHGYSGIRIYSGIYSSYSAPGSRIGGIRIQVFRNENSSQTNALFQLFLFWIDPKRTRPKFRAFTVIGNFENSRGYLEAYAAIVSDDHIRSILGVLTMPIVINVF